MNSIDLQIRADTLGLSLSEFTRVWMINCSAFGVAMIWKWSSQILLNTHAIASLTFELVSWNMLSRLLREGIRTLVKVCLSGLSVIEPRAISDEYLFFQS